MADIDLTQSEADALLAMEKHKVDDQEWEFPGIGASVRVPLISDDRKENFFLDLRRGRIDLAKCTYQNRGRQVVVIARLDVGGQPHRNPDDEEIPSPHLHIYREGYGDKWAFPPPEDAFRNLQDPRKTLADFMQYCNIVEPPSFKWDLFT
jgi:hypothetical protein